MEVGVGMRFVSSGKEVVIGIDVGVELSGAVGIVEVSFVWDIFWKLFNMEVLFRWKK